MRRFLVMIELEVKRAMKALPLMLAEAVFLCVFLSVMLLLCQKLFMGESVFRKLQLGVVAENGNEMTELALHYLEGMESASAVCEFRYLTLEEGREALECGELAALLVLPEEMVEAIMDSRNYPVKVYFPKDSAIGALLIKEMTDAGAGMLSMAQAEVYTIYDMSLSYGKQDSLSQMQNDINLFNMQFALARERLIRAEALEIDGDMPVMTLYAASGITFFFLLWGIACGKFLKGDSRALGGQLERSGVKRWKWMFAKWVGTVAVLAAGALGLMAVVAVVQKEIGIQWLPLLVPVLSCIAALLLLAYQAAPARSSGMMLVFTAAIVILFLSGGFIPSYFLPEILNKIAGWLPCKAMFTAIGQILGTDMGREKLWKACVMLGIWSIGLYASAVAVNHRKEGAGQ